MKKILFVASECVPFIKTGGLADVVGSLPKAFDPAKYDVRVVIPNYTCIPWEYREQMTQLTYFNMEISWKRQYVGIKQLIYQGVTFYFIDNEYYFGGATPYGNMYGDLEKFAFFSKAALAILPVIDFKPDVIHCHDWQAALVPAYLHTLFRNDGFYWNMKTIMTIHNLRFQGVSDIKHMIDISGLPEYVFLPDKMEAFGDANVLKGGLVFADCITTVSNTYAQEIQTPFYGENLNGLLYARRNVLSGIVNGIDYDVYNPDNDSRISVPYNADNFRTEKVKNKRQLQQELGLQVDDNKFIIGVISRMTDQKGFDLIDAVMDQICDSNTQFVLLGTGEKRYEEIFRHYESAKPGVSSSIYYNEDRSHRIYAGCDAILMPSAFEPCGLCQLMGLRYGTVPIVRETGGLKDTVIPYNEFEQSGTGFSFTNYNAQEMLNTINYAKHIFYDTRDAWEGIVERGMRSDYSWNQSADTYRDLYDGIIAEKDQQDGYVRVDEAALAAAKAKEEEAAKKAAEEKAQKEAEAASKKAAAVEAKKKAAADTKKAVEAKVMAAMEPEQPVEATKPERAASKKTAAKTEVKEVKAAETEAKKKRKRTTESDKTAESAITEAPANEAEVKQTAEAELKKTAEAEAKKKAKAEADAKKAEADAKKAAEAEVRAKAKAEADAKKAAEAEVKAKAKAEADAKKAAEAEVKAKVKAEAKKAAEAEVKAEADAKKKAEADAQKAAEEEVKAQAKAADVKAEEAIKETAGSKPEAELEINQPVSIVEQPEVKAEEAPAKPAAAAKKRAPKKSTAKSEVQTEEVKASDEKAPAKTSKRTSAKSAAKTEEAPKKTRTTKSSSKAAAKAEPETKE